MKKRMLSLLIAFMLVCSSIPAVFSESEGLDEPAEVVSTEQVTETSEEQPAVTEAAEETPVTAEEDAEEEPSVVENVTDAPAVEETVQEEVVSEAEEIVEEVSEDDASEEDTSEEEVIAAAENDPAVYTVNTWGIKHLTADAPASVTEGNAVTIVLTAEEGYALPGSVTLTIGGNGVSVKSLTRAEAEELREKNELPEDAILYYTDSGKLVIPAARVIGDIVLNAEGVQIEAEIEEETETETEQETETETEDETEVVSAALEVVITKQPQDVHTKTGVKISFTVAAENVASYQWMYSTNNGDTWKNTSFEGAQTDTLSMTARSTYFPYLWKCVLTDGNGVKTETNAVQLKEPVVAPDVNIIAQPEDVYTKTGVKISFTVEAENVDTYQWMYSTNNGDTWKNTSFEGAQTDTLSMTARSTYFPYLWKCVLKNADGKAVETNAVQMKEPVVAPEVNIIAQPEDVYTKTGVKISFTVEAENVDTYQWMYSSNNGDTWRNTSFEGAQTDTLSMTARSTYFPYLWKCVLKNVDGKAVETNIVQIKEPEAAPEIVITAQPEDVYTKMSVKISFTVKAENVVSYQWMYSLNNGDSWRNTSFEGAQTDTLSMTARTTYLSYLWKCVLTDGDGNQVETAIVQIKTAEPAKGVVITAQPEDQFSDVGKRIYFTVEAENVSTYQWQYSTDDGATWRNTSFEGAQTASLTMLARSTYYPYLWKCVMKNADGVAVETNAVQIKLPVPTTDVVIKTQPADKTADVNKRVSIAVEAENVVTYEWMVSKDDGATWTATTLTGHSTDTLSLLIREEYYDWCFKCVMTGIEGDEAETDVVRVLKPVLSELIVITAQPEDQIAAVGAKVQLTVVAENAAEYQWVYSRDEGVTWRNTTLAGAQTATLTLTVKADYYAWPWKCVMTDAEGNMMDSDCAYLIDPASLKGQIITEPAPITLVANDEDAVLTVVAENIAAYRWQYSEDLGKTWVACTGAGNDTDSVTVVPAVLRNAMWYRCEMVDLLGQVLTTQVVYIQSPVVIHAQPESVIADEGEQATFEVDAEYYTDVLWQYSADNGETWTDCTEESATSVTLVIDVVSDLNGYLFRCVLTGVVEDNVVTTEEVSLTVLTIYADGVAYTLTDGDHYVVTGYKGEGGEVVVLSEVMGLPVTKVSAKAFMSDATITSVTLPSSVTAIGVSAFEGCASLESVTLSNLVNTIERRAFANCTSLKSMNCTD